MLLSLLYTKLLVRRLIMKIKQYWDKFINNCLEMNEVDQLERFFELTLTPAEREKIAARYMILAELLRADKTQREIAAELGVSIFNVTRGANQLKIVDQASKKLIDNS